MFDKIGSKYEETKDLDITEIAKLIRKEIKTAFPDLKTSVRIERFSLGQSLTVKVLHSGLDRRSDATKHIKFELGQIVGQYNFDDSDSMSDYHHSRFYAHFEIES